uniref:Uncharacterized protein n=1 Tax=Setaria italica TaxID=4555 RepID=K3Z1T3_SETIT
MAEYGGGATHRLAYSRLVMMLDFYGTSLSSSSVSPCSSSTTTRISSCRYIFGVLGMHE